MFMPFSFLGYHTKKLAPSCLSVCVSLLCLLFFSPWEGYALDDKKEWPALSLNQGTKWRISIPPFSGEGAGEEISLMLTSLPELLLESLGDIEEHHLSFKERSTLSDRLREEKLRALKTERAKNLRAKSRLFFEIPTPAQKIVSLDEILLEQQKSITHYADLSLTAMKIPSFLPVIFERELPSDQGIEPREMGLIVTGKLNKINDSLYFLKITSENTLRDKAYVLVEETVAIREALEGAGNKTTISGFYRSIEKATVELRSQILGRPWGELAVDVSPAESRIYVNDKLIGVGKGSSKTLPLGPQTLLVSAQGYADHRETIQVTSFAREEKEITLKKIETSEYSLSSLPPGADVYLGSLWIGQTPLILEGKTRKTRLTLKKEGFRDLHFDLEPGPSPPLTLNLQEQGEAITELLRRQKKHFYWASSAVGVSLGIPILLYGIAETYKERVATLQNTTRPYSEPLRSSRITEGFFWGSVGLSITLLGYSLYRLYRYLEAVEKAVH